MLHVYNSMNNQKEPFQPLEEGKVKMYVCGMTVYDYCHLGHARAMVVFDMVSRYLRYAGYDVKYVRNITDIDDKIINRANENGEDFLALTERFIEAMYEDADALGVLRPDAEPKATESIGLIVDMIQRLIDKGAAYQASNGDVYSRVDSFCCYGKLSGKNIDDLRAGERIAVDDVKESPYDFVLWKSAKPGEPQWESPWGAGRPGWHIECSAMAFDELGESFDIHGGGLDLQFPHHENEIAMSEAVTGKTFAKYWLHNGHVRVDQEKMSKSLGNFFTIREILKKYKAEEVRFFLLTSGYRSPLNYTEENLQQAKQSLLKLYTALRGADATQMPEQSEYKDRFIAAMDDDFNTPAAIAVLHELAVEVNKAKESAAENLGELTATLLELGGVLGLLEHDVDEYFQGDAGDAEGGLSAADIDALVAQRNQARADKNWGEADRIRDDLKEQGIVIEDGAGGTSWRRE